MDPNEAWQNILLAISDGDYIAAADQATSLMDHLTEEMGPDLDVDPFEMLAVVRDLATELGFSQERKAAK